MKASAFALIFAGLLSAVPASGQVAQPAPTIGAPAPVADDGSPRRSTYVLGPDDQIVVHVVDVPDMSDRPQRVDPNGDLKLPMVGRVHVAGMTVDELEAELGNRLKTFLKEPDVTVNVTEFHSQSVSIIGAVRSPGVHQLQGRATLVEILSAAGGVAPEQAGPIVRIMRRPEWDPIPLAGATVDPATGVSVVDIDLVALLNSMSPAKNIVIFPNDIISIPPASVVYVVGEVTKVGPVQLTRGDSVTVMEALSASGGVLRTAAPKRARVLRLNTATQTRNEISVDIQQIMQGKVKDMALLSGDILVVPDSSGKRATTRAIEAMFQAGVMIGTYGIVR